MTDTLWADISEFQTPVTDAYPHSIITIRSNDGGHQDAHFHENRQWCDNAVKAGKLAGYIVYYFWRPDGTGITTCKEMVGTPSPHMALMIDVESGSGAKGDQSAEINREHGEAVSWLGNDPKRVIGYGNVSDLNTLWAHKPTGLRLVIAAYGSNPGYPGKFAHQFSDSYHTPPFGNCDINSADGMSLQQVTDLLGIAAKPAPKPAAHQTEKK